MVKNKGINEYRAQNRLACGQPVLRSVLIYSFILYKFSGPLFGVGAENTGVARRRRMYQAIKPIGTRYRLNTLSQIRKVSSTCQMLTTDDHASCNTCAGLHGV